MINKKKSEKAPNHSISITCSVLLINKQIQSVKWECVHPINYVHLNQLVQIGMIRKVMIRKMRESEIIRELMKRRNESR